MAKSAGILIIGNEILSGKTIDQNSGFFARELRELGVDVLRITVIPDDLDAIEREAAALSRGFDFVLTSGGVGPTHDDLTMEGIGRAFGRKLVRNAAIEAILRSYYPEHLIAPNLRMADIPEGAALVTGEKSWFPVVAVENVYIFPGVPEILRRKFNAIKELFRQSPIHLREVFVRVDEGAIAGILHEVLAEFPALSLGSYPYIDNIPNNIKLTLESRDAGYLDRACASLIERLSANGISPHRKA